MPTLDHVTVCGYKTFRELRNFHLNRINVLIGGNGSGKSNFLDFLHLVGQLARELLRVHVKQTGGPDALLTGGSKATSQISAHLTFTRDQPARETNEYRFSLRSAHTDLVFGHEWFKPTQPAVPSDMHPAKDPPLVDRGMWLRGGDFEAWLPGSYRPGFLESLKSWRKYHFQDVGRLAGPRKSVPARDNRVLKPNGSNIAPYLLRLSREHPDAYRRIVRDVRFAVPHFGEFRFPEADRDDKISLEWSPRHDPDTTLGPLELSDGTLRYICLSTLLLQPPELQPSLILVDEPEAGLHPVAITLLAEMIDAVADGKQVIVATQSAQLVSEFDPSDIIVAETEDGMTTFNRLDESQLGDWLNEYSLGDLWLMNHLGGRRAR